jgi:hypothetical protein
MKADRIFWGVILIIFGILFFLQNLGYVSFQFGSIWKLWPLALIYWGFSALLKDKSGKANPALYGIQIVILAVVVYFLVKPNQNKGGSFYDFHPNWENEQNDDGATSNNNEKKREHAFEVPWNTAIETASLKVDFGAGGLTISGESSELLQAEAVTNFGNYAFENNVTGKNASIELAYNAKNVQMNGQFKNELDIQLHSTPLWDISLETGASASEIDLSAYKVSKLEIDGGAMSIALKLGLPVQVMEVDIEAGASSLEIEIPKNAACEIRIEGGLSSLDINGFDKISKGLYRSTGFAAEKPHIQMNVQTGVSSVDINTYE